MAGSAVWLDVLPSMNKFGAQLSKQAGSAAKVAGATAGRQFSAAVSAGATRGAATALVTELEGAAKRAARVVQTEKVAIAKARAEEAAAAKGVEAAEAQLAATRVKNQAAAARIASADAQLAAARAKHGATSTQAAAAEQSLFRAQAAASAASAGSLKAEQALLGARGKAETAGLKVIAVEDQLKAAFGEQKAVTSQLAAAQAQGSKQTALMQSRFARLAAAGAPLSSGLGKVAQGAKSVAANALATLKPLAGLAAGFGAIVGVSNVIKLGNEYTATLNELQAVAGLTDAQMVKVAATSRQLGSDLTLPATSGKDAADIMLELAKGGLSAADAMQAAKGTIQLAAAAQVDGGRAAEIQANSLNQFGLAAKDASMVADVLANTANAAAGGVDDIATSMKYVGPVAATLGVNISDTASAIGILANNGLKGDTAGTALRGMLASLARPSKQAQKAVDALNLSVFDQQGQFVGLRSVIEQLSEARKSMTQEDFASQAVLAFGREPLAAVSALAKGGAANFDEMAKAVDRQGGAAAVAQSKMKGLGGAMDKLQSQLEDVALGIYQTVTPALTGAVSGIAAGLDGAGAKVEDFLAIAGGLGKLTFSGKTTAPIAGFDPKVVAGIQAARTIVIAAFKDIQTFVVQSLIPAMRNIVVAVAPVAAVIGGTLLLAFRAAAAVLKFIGPALVAVTRFFKENHAATFAVAGAIAGLVVAYKVYNAQLLIARIGMAKYLARIPLVAAAQKAWAFSTWLVTGATRALSAAWRASPIGVVITALGLLVAGVIWAYKNLGWFKTAVDAVWNGIKVGAKAVGDAFVWLWTNGIKPAINWIADAATWLWTTVLQPVFNGIAAVVKFVVGLYIAYFKLWIAVFKTIGNAAVWLYQNALKPAFDGIMVAVRFVGAVFTWWWKNIVTPVFNGIAAVAGWFGNTISAIFDLVVAMLKAVLVPAFLYFKGIFSAVWSAVVGVLKTAWTAIVSAVQVAWNVLSSIFMAVVNVVRATLGAAFTWLWESVISPVVNWIVGAVTLWWNATKTTFTAAVNFIRSTLAAAFMWFYQNVVKPVIDWIVGAFQTWWKAVRIIFTAVVTYVRNTLGAVFTWLYRNIIKPVWDSISTIISTVWNNGIKPVFDTISNFATKTIPDAFNTMKDAVSTAWEAIKTAAKAPIKFVVNTVVNDALIGNFNKVADVFGTKHITPISLPKGFAGGGVIPGYQSARRDDVMTPMRRGEGVLVPEVVRALGPGFIHSLNAAGNRGGVTGVRKATGYASGGIVGAGKDILSGAIDATRNVVSLASDLVTDPAGTISAAVKGLIGKIPGAGSMVELAGGFGRKILDGAVQSLQNIVGSFLPSGGSGANGSIPGDQLGKATNYRPGSGVGAMGGYLRAPAAAAWNAMVAASGGLLTLTEGYRDLASQQFRWAQYKAGRGNLAAAPGTSVHGFGLAADIGAGQAWARANGARFGWYPTGLSFSQREPWHFEYKGAKAKGGMAAGGIVGGLQPTLYDEGGILPRGLSLVQNNLRKPEVALPVQTLREIVSTDGGKGNTYSPTFVNSDRSTVSEFESWVHRREVLANG